MLAKFFDYQRPDERLACEPQRQDARLPRPDFPLSIRRSIAATTMPAIPHGLVFRLSPDHEVCRQSLQNHFSFLRQRQSHQPSAPTFRTIFLKRSPAPNDYRSTKPQSNQPARFWRNRTPSSDCWLRWPHPLARSDRSVRLHRPSAGLRGFAVL